MYQVRYLLTALAVLLIGGCSNNGSDRQPPDIPDDITAVFNKPLYNDSTWALTVVDMESGNVIYDLRSDQNLYAGSLRKLFTMGEALVALGSNYTFRTPVYRQGEITGDGILTGDLILVASGDLTMGGRRNVDGTMAVSNFDHNEANSLGNAALTTPDPLWGYDSLAEQVAASGVKAISGDVIIDDRLFRPFNFREEFNVRPIFVNDDVVDVVINLTNVGELATVDHEPKSQAFKVSSNLLTVSSGVDKSVHLMPEYPDCIGIADCSGSVIGEIPIDFVPPLTQTFPLVQTFRIVEPSNYARTVFIEALQRAGVSVETAPAVAPNNTAALPPKDSYTSDALLAELVSLPFSEYAKYVLKVSYNIGADTSLVLWGLTKGVDNMEDALAIERENLTQNIGIPGDEFEFFDGSGGGPTTATNNAVIQMLEYNSEQADFPAFFAALPVLGVDGSLSFVTDFEADSTLAGAKGNVFAKTGTYATGNEDGILLLGQAFAGYIDAKSGRRLAYSLRVDNTPIGEDMNNILEVFQDQGTVSAVVWRDN
jgi:D-alanyl-D-alanine carboxypeptidase/D-alanyl-D-alanine-endopeptidase (penicillin-binding protein 4)